MLTPRSRAGCGVGMISDLSAIEVASTLNPKRALISVSHVVGVSWVEYCVICTRCDDTISRKFVYIVPSAAGAGAAAAAAALGL